MVTPRPTCAPSAIAHPVNAAEVWVQAPERPNHSHWLMADGSAVTNVSPDTARAVAAELAARYERIAAGLRAFAGEPEVCERPANPWPWPCDGNASPIIGTGPAAVARRARRSHLRADVCAAVPRLVQP
jgi:hypothetical protein